MENDLLRHLEFLTSIRPFRNWTNRESLEVVVTYIAKEFNSYGLETSEQTWSYGKFEFKNSIAKYRPELTKRLIIGAHYDVCGSQPGADDNGSGVAGMLVLAKMIADQAPDLPYGIDFVSYCLEEPPHFATVNMGSYIHAKSLFDSKTPVIGMICLDMIGYFSDEEGSQSYPEAFSGLKLPTTGNYIAVIGLKEYAAFSTEIFDRMKAAETIPVQLVNFPNNEGLAGLSDHRNYWLFGFPALMINDTAILRNPNYHKPSDTIETLDLSKMAAVIEALFQAIFLPIFLPPSVDIS